MRPVNKGHSPYKTISHYSNASPFLEQTIGAYCSYCGMRLTNMPEVEHKESKVKSPDKATSWENLLFGCKYCNTRKGDIVDKLNVDNYLWPDQDNTAIAYTYENGMPAVNATALMSVDPSGAALNKAYNLFHLVKLDHIPNSRDKDRRFRLRNAVFERAKDSLEDYQRLKIANPDTASVFVKQIIRTALADGFFSVWTTVFNDEADVLNALIEAYPGTEKGFFDTNGQSKFILKKPTTSNIP